MKFKSIMPSCGLLFAITFTSTNVIAAEAINDSPEDLASLRQELSLARETIANAQQVAKNIVDAANVEAEAIRRQARGESIDSSLDPESVRSELIAIDISSGTLEQIVRSIMPQNWRIRVDLIDVRQSERRFQFVSTRTREQALADLLIPLGFNHQYFFELKDETGAPSPLLVISERKG